MMLTAPDALFQSGLNRQIVRMRQQLDRSSIEMVTGRTQDPLRAVRGNNDVLLRARAAIDAAEPERARLNVLEGRYRTAGSALKTIRELTGEAARSAQAAGDIAAGVDADRFAATEARSALASTFATLEARFGGRSLFGGTLGTGRVLEDVTVLVSEIETAVSGLSRAQDVSDAIRDYFVQGGDFETNIYRGGDPLPEPELDNGRSVASLPSANDESLRTLYRGLAMVAVNQQVDVGQRAAFLREASELIETAREALVADEASIGLALNVIGAEQDRQEQLLFDAETTMENLLGRDPFEAASETQSLEARLQAAYTVTSRMAALRLTNFLR